MERKKQKKIQSKNGITLIALVITIVVLLILAGISIQMLTGNNGILQKAGQAKESTDEAQIIEEAKIDILAFQTSKLGDSLTEAELEGILSPKYGTLSTAEERTIDKKLTTIDGKVIPVSKIYNGSLIALLPTIADADEKDYYGNFIDYDVDLDDTTNDYDWKIFYNDGTNIYIIAEDYVKMDKCSNLTTTATKRADGGTTYPYSLYWPYNNGNFDNNKTGSVDIFGTSASSKTLSFANKFLIDWKPKVTGTNSASEDSNAKMTATLMDTNLWSSFATSTKVSGLTKKADELAAIGSPTLEMWVKSWNKIHGANSDDASTEGASALELYYASNSTGYFVGTSENPNTNSSLSAYQSGTTGYTDTLYYPQTPEIDNCYAYWLASPSASDASGEVIVYYDGHVGYNNFIFNISGVRPVVCLPSDITATWNETDGVWNIIKK